MRLSLHTSRARQEDPQSPSLLEPGALKTQVAAMFSGSRRCSTSWWFYRGLFKSKWKRNEDS